MATETKFTPGPWHTTLRVGMKARLVYSASTALDICTVKYEQRHRDDEPLFNARLIAAAPELYEALEAIIAWEQSEDGPFAWEVLGQAKSALAKARGEA